MADGKIFISVILPVKLDWEPVYYVPSGESVCAGNRVYVRFAGKKYLALVSVADVVPDIAESKILPVLSVESQLAVVGREELDLWRFVADYYMCSVGEVYKAAYPSVKIGAELVKMRSAMRADTARTRKLEILSSRITRAYATLERRKVLLDKAVKPDAKERYAILVAKSESEIMKLSAEIEGVKEGRDKTSVAGGGRLDLQFTLSSAQKKAVDEIHDCFNEKMPVLLQGVTGSGKTEIYISLAQETLAQGRNVLYLIPEIAISRQLEARLSEVFGDKLLVFHSKETSAARFSVVESVRNASYIVLGTRSAVFLPHHELGLIIVDEEHDMSYKQDAPAPRYNGRDTALILARIHKSDVILGTATPSLESLYNCHTGRFGKVILTERYFGAEDSDVEIINTSAERKKRGMSGCFSFKLAERINSVLASGGQVLILRGRRAYSPSVQCENCGDIPHCPHCNVPLSWHREEGMLLCHYCGWRAPFNTICAKCGSVMQPLGTGTQRVEEDAKNLFPNAVVARLDSDTASSTAREVSIIKDFATRKIDILIGTQIVTKGFDFPGLSLVAVIQADSLLGQQDFRADERTVQLLEQFRGRCGRRGNRGLFVIQTANPSHPVYSMFGREVSVADLENNMLSERYAFGYPPFTRIIKILLKDKDEKRLDIRADALAGRIRNAFGVKMAGFVQATSCPVSVLGPYAPAVNKVSDFYIRHIRLGLKKDAFLPDRKRKLSETVSAFGKEHNYSGNIAIDVDPI